MSPQVGQMSDIRVEGGWIGGIANERILPVGCNEGDVHVSAVPWKALSGFGHEAWSNAVLNSECLDDVPMHTSWLAMAHDERATQTAGKGTTLLEQPRLISHVLRFAKL